MKKGLMVIVGMVLFSFTCPAVVYHLEKVNKVVDGEKYVFMEFEMALTADGVPMTEAGGSVPLTSTYSTKDLLGDEYYVWTLKKIVNSSYKMVCYVNVGLKNVSNSVNLRLVTKTTEGTTPWCFDFDEDSLATIYTTENGVRTLGRTNQYSSEYKAYLSNPTYKGKFAVYRLVPDTYDREVTIGQLGTLCLPYAVDKVIGAEVYQIAYLEKDGQGNPQNLYYDLVETELEAGHPYLFVPTAAKVSFQKKNTTTVADPQYKNDGFYGTFAPIQDGVAGTAGNQLEGKYMVRDNTFQKCGGSCSLKANRAYIDMTKVPTTPPQSGAQGRMLVLSPSGVEYITGIEEITYEKQAMKCEKRIEEGQLVIIRNGQRYNIQGGKL